MGLALLAIQADDPVLAREQYTFPVSSRGTMLWFTVAVDRLLGLLSQTMRNIEQAAAHFEDALAFCRKAGYRPELAWACHDYAGAILVGADFRPAPTLEDRAKAMSLLDEALAISSELGMRPLLERVHSLKE